VKNLAVPRMLAYRTDVLTQSPVRGGHSVLGNRVEVRREVREVVVVEFEGKALGLLNDPMKSFVGEAIGESGLLKLPDPAIQPCPEVGRE
jgi:hypothetical protein